jgi:type I restriction enzyme S subunit
MSSVVPDGWDYSSFQSIVKDYKGSIVDGPFGSNLKTSDYVGSGVPVLQGKNVTNDRFVWSDVRYITVEKAKELSRSSVRVGEILMVKIGSVGYSAIVDDLSGFDYAIIPANLMKIDIDESKALTKYVHHYMTSPEGKRRIVDEASSTAQPALSLGTMKKFKLPIPPLPEQKKIASILTSVDEVIENTQKQIDKLQDLKKATMNELLTKGIGHTEFKDSELGRIPKSWDVINLGSISQVVDSMHQTPTFSDHGKAMVRVTEIRNGEFIDISSAVNVNEETYKAFTKNYKPRLGDILIARVGAYFGATTYVDKEVTFCLGQNTAAIRPKDIESDFLFFFINSECVSNQMNDVVSVGAQPSLSLEVIKKIKVVCPPDSEQKLIAKSIFSITSKIINTNLKLSQTQSLKKSLMQHLLTGKVRVTVN